MIEKLRNMVWTTGEGEKIKVRDMKTYHIKNCVNLLRKKGCISIKEYKANPFLDRKKVAKFLDIFRIELFVRGDINMRTADNILYEIFHKVRDLEDM